jgi:hypothetical protein
MLMRVARTQPGIAQVHTPYNCPAAERLGYALSALAISRRAGLDRGERIPPINPQTHSLTRLQFAYSVDTVRSVYLAVFHVGRACSTGFGPAA